METLTPENIDALKKLASDKLSYRNRLAAVDELGKFKCQQSKDILWRLMINDLAYAVQEQAFRKLQAFGEDVKLPKKKKGHLIKDINKKLESVRSAMSGEYTPDGFNAKFKSLYPEAYDIYSYEKGANFQKWIENIVLPPKARA